MTSIIHCAPLRDAARTQIFYDKRGLQWKKSTNLMMDEQEEGITG